MGQVKTTAFCTGLSFFLSNTAGIFEEIGK